MNNLTIKEIQDIVSGVQKPTGDKFLDDRYTEQVRIVGHVQPYYRAFYWLAKALKPKLAVELGSWQATAAACLASANPEGRVITIDIHKDDKDAQKRTIEAAAYYDNLTYLNGWTWDVYQDVADMKQLIELLYIDAWHQPEYLERDWLLYGPMLAPHHLIIVDDVFEGLPNIKGVIEFFDKLDGEKFLISTIHPGIPMGFCLQHKTEEAQPVRKTTSRKRKTI